MNILVTGGTGFTGKALVKRLLDEGHRVRALDYKEGLKTDELRQWGAEVVIGSVADRDVVEKSMENIEIVFHIAAAFRQMNVPDSYYWQVNVAGTRNVLEAAHNQNVRRFVYCSTCGVHGDVEAPPAAEDAPIKPADYYQQTKYEGELVVEEYVRKGMKTVILRPAAIYGPGDPERFVMIYRRAAKGKFPIFGKGTAFYHPLYIDNLVDSFLLVMQDGVGDGQTYLIADEEYLPIRELVRRVGAAMGVDVQFQNLPLPPLIVAGHVCEAVCKPLGITPPIFPRRVDWYRQNRAFDIGKAKREIGYRPRVGLDEGLRRTAGWYRKNGYLPADSIAAGGLSEFAASDAVHRKPT